MYIKLSIIQRLVSDVKFRKRLATVLNVTSQAVFLSAKKYCESPIPDSTFTRIAVIDFFKSEDYQEDYFLVKDKSAI